MELAILLAGAAAVVVPLAVFLFQRRERHAEQAGQRRAALYAERGDIRWSPVEYDLTIGNAGPAVARNVRVWLEVGDSRTSAERLPPMQPMDHLPLTIDLGRPLAHREGTRTPAKLRASWTDDNGKQEETLIPDLPSGP